jgi:hypothetical protein
MDIRDGRGGGDDDGAICIDDGRVGVGSDMEEITNRVCFQCFVCVTEPRRQDRGEYGSILVSRNIGFVVGVYSPGTVAVSTGNAIRSLGSQHQMRCACPWHPYMSKEGIKQLFHQNRHQRQCVPFYDFLLL